MYLTAHHVRSRDGASGRNAYYHVHGGDLSLDWGSAATIERVADTAPGRLTAGRIEIHPGGNDVLSYLDITAQDGTPPDAIRNALNRFRSAASRPGDLARSVVVDRIGVRFSLQSGLGGQEHTEFELLCQQLYPLLDNPEDYPIPGKEPLTVLVTSGPEIVFELDSTSSERVRRMQGFTSQPASIRMSPETQADFRTIHGSVVPHILPTLTGLPLESLASLGVAFVDKATKEKLDEWPRCPQPV